MGLKTFKNFNFKILHRLPATGKIEKTEIYAAAKTWNLGIVTKTGAHNDKMRKIVEHQKAEWYYMVKYGEAGGECPGRTK